VTKKRIAILGSTGSIGQSALAVVDAYSDRLQVVGLAAGENADRFADQIARYRPRVVAMASGAALDRLSGCGAFPGVALAGAGSDGLVAVASHPDVDLVLCASSGTDGLEAVLAAIECRKTVALANKEVLVMAGALVTCAARRSGVSILPVDSEHSAVHQCLHGRPRSEMKRLVLTASGGPFLGRSAADLAGVSAADALKHPTWRMGRKITIDSATLMNKGLEVIEATLLFGLAETQVDVVVHPQSVVHSLVEYADGSMLAQLGAPDMRTPIAQALAWPERMASGVQSLDLVAIRQLDFEPPDHLRFPSLGLARAAARAGGTAPTVLNAANEVAVQAFLDRRLNFVGISAVIDKVLQRLDSSPVKALGDVLDADAAARRLAVSLIELSVGAFA
jgi:1-deoxy-D-xylulose-5-phosphate reductoisomerase